MATRLAMSKATIREKMMAVTEPAAMATLYAPGASVTGITAKLASGTSRKIKHTGITAKLASGVKIKGMKLFNVYHISALSHVQWRDMQT